MLSQTLLNFRKQLIQTKTISLHLYQHIFNLASDSSLSRLRLLLLQTNIFKMLFIYLTEFTQNTMLKIMTTVYINYIVISGNDCNRHFYADDCILYFIDNSVILQDKLINSKLLLSLDKSKFMLLTRTRDINSTYLPILTSYGTKIE